MELQQARYVVAVAKCQNFTRAAETCHVTQPALTRAIQRLETELGGNLIVRERKRTQLTDLGKLVLPELESMVAAADDAQLRAKNFRSREIAPLRIGLTPCVSANLIVRPLAEIARLMPGLRVDVVEHPADRLAAMLLDGEVNAAIAGATEPSDRIDHWRLFEEQFSVLVAGGHQLASRPQVSLKTLEEMAWLERAGCEFLREFWPLISSRVPLNICHRGQHEGHLQQLAAAGLGAMLIADHSAHLPSLARIPIEGSPLRRDVRLLAVAGRQYSPALDAFIKCARLLDWQTEIGRSEFRQPGTPAGDRSLSQNVADLRRVDQAAE
jgi:DNA-binding transcriptional LysR family regulator